MNKRLRSDIVILAAALILGFAGGTYYANHKSKTNNPPASSTPRICNCQMMPVNASPADYSKCCR